MAPRVVGRPPSSWFHAMFSTSMFWMLPISAGSEPEIELTEKSIHERLCRSPMPVQLVMDPVMLLSRSDSAVIRPYAHESPSR